MMFRLITLLLQTDGQHFKRKQTVWKSIYDSVQGTSHKALGTPCQDSCRVVHVELEFGSYLIAVCSDGAGSASYSDIGATLVCDAFADIATTKIKSGGFVGFTSDEAATLCHTLRSIIHERAAELSVPSRELACTFLGAIIGETLASFIQIGDGAMVIARGDDEYSLVFWPQSGEYVNTTNFITEHNIDELINVATIHETINGFAAFTDGLERLALNFSEQRVHQPFFSTLFRPLRETECVDEFFEPLRKFLDSDGVNERTDDDKTLILAARAGTRNAGIS